MASNLKVGDTVVLNDMGLQSIFGRVQGLSLMKTKRMKVTHVDAESMTNDYPSYVVHVDDPEIDFYLLIDYYFDKVAV